MFLESFNSCIFISAIILVSSNTSLVIHPHISLISNLVVLYENKSEEGGYDLNTQKWEENKLCTQQLISTRHYHNTEARDIQSEYNSGSWFRDMTGN